MKRLRKAERAIKVRWNERKGGGRQRQVRRMSETLAILDKRWRSACKVLFRQDIGPLSGYDGWLDELIDRNRHEKSCVSGKDVVLAIKEYSKGARFVSLDELDFNEKYVSIPFEDADNLESLLAIIRDRLVYTGNLITGNSGHVEKSTNISDSFFVYDSAQYGDSKYLYKCTVGRVCEDCFGTHGPGESQLCVRCTQTFKDTRCFEAWMTQNCSDIYYSYNMDNCSECFFCFNLRSKHHCIGNVQLAPEKYAKAKARLLSEMAEMLKRDKKLPSLMDIVAKSTHEKPKIPALQAEAEGGGKEDVEREFTKTAKLVLEAELSGIDKYADWLYRHAHKMEVVKSAASGKRMFFLPYVTALPDLPKDRMLTMEEALWHGENSAVSQEDAEGMGMENTHEKIGKLAYFSIEFREGKNPCITDCLMSLFSSYCYRTSGMVYAKYCACGMWPRSSERCFGFDTLWDCSFCINCYHSVKLTRCFEMDSCHSCTDSYFCHNAENCHDAMFCFNTKNLKYAIGNVEVGRERYMKIKKTLLAEIGKRLEKEHGMEIGIYSIGERK